MAHIEIFEQDVKVVTNLYSRPERYASARGDDPCEVVFHGIGAPDDRPEDRCLDYR